MARRALVVCTANVCRSPLVARLLQRSLDDAVARGAWIVTSAGLADLRENSDPSTIAAARSLGIDLSDHRRRALTREVLDRDGADIVITMTREHVRQLVSIDPAAWYRTFTLKELVRRATTAHELQDGSFESWLHAVSADRTTEGMMTPDLADDIADPYGAPRRHHDAMAAEASRLVDSLVRLAPWDR